MKSILFNLIYYLKSLSQIFYKPTTKKIIIKSVPYYTQKDTGAKSKKQDLLWRHNGCGMACLKMILATKKKGIYSISKLGEMAKEYGCYRDNPRSEYGMDGMFYQPFLEFIDREFDLSGKIISPLTINDIIRGIDEGKLVIVSVSPEIRNFESSKIVDKNGGHLILVIGYDFANKFLIFNNTGYIKRQEKTKILFNDFDRYFASRGIIID